MSRCLLTTIKIVLFVLLGGVCATSIKAQQCNIKLNYGIIISAQHIRFIEDDKTYVQINGQDQLFVNGREAELSIEQSKLIQGFSSGIRESIPLIVNFAIEGIDVGLAAAHTITANIVGRNSQTQQELQNHLDEIKMNIRKRFNHTNSNYFMAPQSFNDFDELFVGQFEQEIEKILKESLGSILIVVGEAINNYSEGNTNNLTLQQRIERIGTELEIELRPRISSLKSQASIFCKQLEELSKMEKQVTNSVTTLEAFDLIENY